jgi:hypothetical protein
MRNTTGKGWFVILIDAIEQGKLTEKVWSPSWTTTVGKNALNFIFMTVAGGSEFAVRTKKGWYSLIHPDLGQLSWKSGFDFRSGGRYFFLRLNGKEIIHVWPEHGARCYYAREDQVPSHLGWIEK